MSEKQIGRTQYVKAELAQRLLTCSEVRRDLFTDPIWGGGGDADWYTASMLAASRIQREASRDVLIVIEGINWVGVPVPSLPHYRPELHPVRHLSHALPYPDKLVYSSHFYAYTGPNATGAGGGFGSTNDPTYGDLSTEKLRSTFNALAGYVATAADAVQQHYTAPVWISEFGVGGRNDFSAVDRRWWANFTQILRDGDLDFAVWPLLGWQENGQGDLWALNAYDSQGAKLSILDSGDWRLSGWRNLTNDSTYSRNDTVEPMEVWRMLAPDWGSQQQSNWLLTHNPSQPGSNKASCPDGLRLQGLSHTPNPRGLCTDAHFGRSLWDVTNDLTVVQSQRHVSKDWAHGYTKFECPSRSFLVGYSYSAPMSKSAICAPIVSEAPTTNATLAMRRTVWFDGGSNAAATVHGDFAGPGTSAGACDEGELAVGYAFTNKGKVGGPPAALLCESYDGKQREGGQASGAASRGIALLLSFIAMAVTSLMLRA